MDSCSNNNRIDIDDLNQPLKDVIAAQVVLGKAIGDMLVAGAGAALGVFRGAELPGVKSRCGCDIPEPCWMPKPLGVAKCHLAEGGQGEIRLEVVNADYQGHMFAVAAAGVDAPLLTVSDPSFSLGPMERRVVTVSFVMPAQGQPRYDFLIWVRGCGDHYLRWVVSSGHKTRCCCHEVCVEDKPDYVVHWYDHFYCKRPCMGERTRQGISEPVTAAVGS
jgi:hypothetical protein